MKIFLDRISVSNELSLSVSNPILKHFASKKQICRKSSIVLARFRRFSSIVVPRNLLYINFVVSSEKTLPSRGPQRGRSAFGTGMDRMTCLNHERAFVSEYSQEDQQCMGAVCGLSVSVPWLARS